MNTGDTGLNSLPEEVLKAELDAIGKRRRVYGLSDSSLADRLVGLALSGGGIRSATFALGVLQRLAKADLLHRFDYLSTVSGGGYIGGSLTWLLSQIKKPRPSEKNFPTVTSSPHPKGGVERPETSPTARKILDARSGDFSDVA